LAIKGVIKMKVKEMGSKIISENVCAIPPAAFALVDVSNPEKKVSDMLATYSQAVCSSIAVRFCCDCTCLLMRIFIYLSIYLSLHLLTVKTTRPRFVPKMTVNQQVEGTAVKPALLYPQVTNKQKAARKLQRLRPFQIKSPPTPVHLEVKTTAESGAVDLKANTFIVKMGAVNEPSPAGLAEVVHPLISSNDLEVAFLPAKNKKVAEPSNCITIDASSVLLPIPSFTAPKTSSCKRNWEIFPQFRCSKASHILMKENFSQTRVSATSIWTSQTHLRY
jgi:hypothetical protein